MMLTWTFMVRLVNLMSSRPSKNSATRKQTGSRSLEVGFGDKIAFILRNLSAETIAKKVWT
jgi:hypothetical protein